MRYVDDRYSLAVLLFALTISVSVCADVGFRVQ
jgi:hypothetical protein